MSTQRQKRVAKLIVENVSLPKPLNGAQIVEKSSYSKAVQIKPGQVLNSQGVKEELEILGFTPLAAKTVVSKIMNDDEVEPNARLKAADMTFKVHGSYAPEKSVIVNVDIVSEEDLSVAKNLLDERIRSKTSSPKGDGIVSVPLGGEIQDKE